MAGDDQRLSQITLDEHGIVRLSPRVEHERRVAVQDLIDENTFQPQGNFTGPYHLKLGVAEGRLRFEVEDEQGNPVADFSLSQGSFKSIIRDYFMVCDSYYEAIKTSSPSKIEAIDMGRRGLHNDGADLLREKMAKYAAIDDDTARRLFTLICVLNIRS